MKQEAGVRIHITNSATPLPAVTPGSHFVTMEGMKLHLANVAANRRTDAHPSEERSRASVALLLASAARRRAPSATST